MLTILRYVMEKLGINIELLLKSLDPLANIRNLDESEQQVICYCLLAYSRPQIAELVNLSELQIRDKLSHYIYPKIAELMGVEQTEIANNWAKILNFLLDPNQVYKLYPSPQLNSDNFQASFGRQSFLYPPNQEIVKLQTQAINFYQSGRYYEALKYFLMAWDQEIKIYGRGNPEILIYINNSLIEHKRNKFPEKNIKIYNIAVVVPFYHNLGQVSAEILRGISQIQLQVNWENFKNLGLEKEIDLNSIKPNVFSTLISSQVLLQILIVNDPNNLYTPYNQTAEKLAALAKELNLMAIIGHYSSEMTKNAFQFYADKSLVLVNACSTSNELADLSLMSFFRLTTPDKINAKRLSDYLGSKIAGREQSKIALIYNHNSLYCQSYRNSIKRHLESYQEKVIFLEECGYINESYYQVQEYIETIQRAGVDMIIIIPDGGLQPNSLNNAGLISRLNLNKCLIAGTATFYQENVLHWIHEQSQYQNFNQDHPQIIASIPWHWHSEQNGCNSENIIAQYFCKLGTQLWGEENLNWRSATAFDAVLIILKVIEKYHSKNSQDLLEHMDQYFKYQKRKIRGVTGDIQFEKTGDRINPPTEIVAVKWNSPQQKWQWTI
ncbi:ABC transporter substrate-binding protein [Anabaena sp. UHCC 0399]|uniref:ABC transporter substrate-binding protein n=1 Tax=Anabaena sp. UHCC 0399 TaxID=3110238 RepID=UPI002B2107FF|nr:ABC transporter substrate-binding protein [Anabaena sp. UHCC 0399]MEA5565476.1 ABC transporter substrate-binding protein [Anabaena sp. UHCC 0399]